MESSIQLAGLGALFVLPGALYVFGFERIVGRWGVGLSDRLMRFLGGSAIFNALFAYPIYSAWGRYGVSGEVSAGAPLPLVIWLGLIAYVALPFVLGSLTGSAVKRRWRGLSWVAGPHPGPRGWDHCLLGHPAAGSASR